MFTALLLSVLFPVVVALSGTPDERANELLSQMSIEEKMAMLHGHPGVYIGNIVGNDRLGIPALKMQDGPQGFRTTLTTGEDGTTTAWPSAMTIASSWDENLVFRWASAMATEFKGKGANVALAPGVGIARVPTAGRNFEYVSGEDPILGAAMARQIVHGIQGEGIIANAKHWVNNEIETDRKRVSAVVSERARWEIYYPPFEAAIEAGVLSVMCAYNRVNDVYACENSETLSHLKDPEWLGFNGWVMSDWTATRSTVDSVLAGNDQEMPVGLWYSEKALTAALANNTISEMNIDNSVRRMLTSMFTIGLFDGEESSGDPLANVTSTSHNDLAREIAAKSTVLLKNRDSLLPLTSLYSAESATGCIAVLGDNTTISGGGSGHVKPAYVITPAEGIKNALAAMGVSQIEVRYLSGVDIEAAVQLASECTIAIVNVATTCSEGSDRESLSLGAAQDDLVAAVAGANPSGTIVSVVAPGAVLMPWADSVKSVLMSWLPGQEAGNALADVLFGVVNPSARLPISLPNKENEVGFTTLQFPGVGLVYPEAVYSEELLIGYRWYDSNNVSPAYPFGHGLSYTSFAYGDFQLEKADSSDSEDAVMKVQFSIENSGLITGAEVPQLYLAFPAHAREPPQLLKKFTKVTLAPEEKMTISFELTKRDVSVWSVDSKSWTVVIGEIGVSVGASSRDIRLAGSFLSGPF